MHRDDTALMVSAADSWSSCLSIADLTDQTQDLYLTELLAALTRYQYFRTFIEIRSICESVLAERCNYIAKFGYCHNMSSVL